MIIWLIGLSGAGKTTIGRRLYSELKKSHENLVYLDGDILRDVWGIPLGHDVEGRAENAHRVSHLCRLLDRQGIHVITSILSIFPDWQTWNRENFSQYFEVFIDVPKDILVKRDPKGLYRRALDGEMINVVGVDIEFPVPANADLVIDNAMELEDPSSLAFEILPHVKRLLTTVTGSDRESLYPYSEGDLLEVRNTYFYTKIHSQGFFEIFNDARGKTIPAAIKPRAIRLPENEPSPPDQSEIQTADILDWLVFHWSTGNNRNDVRDYTDMLVRRFEISKRIHAAYDVDQKPLDRNDYNNHELYIRAAEMFILAYRETGAIQQLNVLLKIMDTITSLTSRLNEGCLQRVANLVEKERTFVEELKSTCQ